MQIVMQVTGLQECLANLSQLPGQVRFGASVGMNRTLNEAQDAIRATLPSHFTLRRAAFINNTIYRKPGEDWASKTKLSAGVRVDDRRNVLAKFEEGGEKLPTNGRKFLAIPIDVKTNKLDIVTPAYSVKALLSTGKAYVRDGKVWMLLGRGKIRRRILAYVFKPEVPIQADLHFVETAIKVINDRSVANIEGAITQELTTGLTSSNGPSA